MRPASTLSQLRQALPQGLPPSFGVYLKNTLVALCHALEDHILQAEQSQPLVLTTFQQGKWYLQEADRYAQIASRAGQIVIAALPDSGFHGHRTSQLPNVALVDLDPEDTLVQEWNLIILDDGYAAMVLCQEVPDADYGPQGPPDRDMERKFFGLWTFDRPQVEAAAEILLNQFHAYQPQLVEHCHSLQQSIRMASHQSHQQDLSPVVTRIVNYLQTSQEQLITLQRQTREFWELEHQALRLNRNINANKLQAFLRMAQRVDSQDPDNPVASFQVSALCETLGQLLDLPTLQLRRLRLAGLLFRIGLAQAPADVFSHPESYLDTNTQTLWSDQVLVSSQLLMAMPEMTPIAKIIAQHLEHWDGSGYPEGLQGEAILLEARILGLVRFFQGLTQPRGTRPAQSPSQALELCRQLSQSWFDPQLIETLTTVIRLSEMGMMKLPDRPSHVPAIWLDEPASDPSALPSA